MNKEEIDETKKSMYLTSPMTGALSVLSYSPNACFAELTHSL
jgi:hypothetical protein